MIIYAYFINTFKKLTNSFTKKVLWESHLIHKQTNNNNNKKYGLLSWKYCITIQHKKPEWSLNHFEVKCDLDMFLVLLTQVLPQARSKSTTAYTNESFEHNS